MTEELTYILSLLSEQERDVIKAIIVERDELKADLAAEKSLRHSRESALDSLTQTYVDVVEERSKLEAEVARLRKITDFMNDIGFSYKVDRRGDAYIHSDDYGDFYYSREQREGDRK